MQQGRAVRAYVNIEIKSGSAADDLSVIRDISLTGCLLVTRAKLKQSQQVPLTIPLDGGGELRVTGTVVRRQGGGPGEWEEYGVSFDELTEEERRALALVVAEGVEPPPEVGAEGA